jgi:3-(3-hydroxy-phenyl)propionate hydroxylase
VVAPQWRAGNVFLAGDSCHQMPPFLGQGLNSGSRDAVNLAWKLALVHRGLAHDRVLDTFTSERVPHVRSTVEHAVDTGRLIDQLAGRESHGVDRSAGYGGTRPQPILGPGVLVPGHPWVGHPLKFCPEIVTALDANTPTFAIVSRDAVRVPDSFAGLRVVQVRAEPAVTDGHHAVIVRPDRYVAAVVTDPNDLEQAARTLTEALRPTS